MAVGLVAVASTVSYLTFRDIIVQDYTARLENEISLVKLKLPDTQHYQQFARLIKDTTGSRLTLIDADGTVFADSEVSPEGMENHAMRPEILAATGQQSGMAIRYSETLKVDLLYVAKKVEIDGRVITVRMAMELTQMLKRFWSILTDIIIVLVIFMAFALFLTFRTSKRLESDVEAINRYLDAIGGKNYKAVLKVKYYKEFLQIALQLKNVVKRLRQREKQRRKYTAKLRLINQQRSDILSALSHEFKNPLAVIVGYAETLRDDEAAAPQIRHRFLEKILANAEKMSGMLDRLSFSVKLENSDLQMRMVGFDMADVAEDVVTNLGKKYSEREISHDVESTPVYGDKQMMELVLTNLLDNALKYSEERVEVSLREGVLRVIDYGVGIPRKEIENITSKYYRVVKNTWDNSMGLGLSIVAYILKQHNTRLNISSDRGKGSVFSFDLSPMQRCTLQAPKEKEATSAQSEEEEE